MTTSVNGVAVGVSGSGSSVIVTASVTGVGVGVGLDPSVAVAVGVALDSGDSVKAGDAGVSLGTTTTGFCGDGVTVLPDCED